ncbi:MAG: hypothetical protein GY729_07320 [Desulfobacteraceae bacterium]|nr:hypothetical protein [Desulfobacteraceae bacterium]
MDNKKLAAGIAAVFDYIKTQEEAAAAAAASYVPEVEQSVQDIAPQVTQVIQMIAAPAQNINLWGISGREAHMQTRTMMQLKMFK